MLRNVIKKTGRGYCPFVSVRPYREDPTASVINCPRIVGDPLSRLIIGSRLLRTLVTKSYGLKTRRVPTRLAV